MKKITICIKCSEFQGFFLIDILQVSSIKMGCKADLAYRKIFNNFRAYKRLNDAGNCWNDQ